MKKRKPETYGTQGRIPETPTQCIKTVYDHTLIMSAGHQCSRKRGYGPDGLYCKQHDPVRKRKREDTKYQKWDKEQRAKVNDFRRAGILADMAEGIPTNQLKKYKLVLKKK